MAKNELFSDKMSKFKKPLAFLLLVFFALIDYQLVKRIFVDRDNKSVYLKNEMAFGSVSDVGMFLSVTLFILLLIMYLFRKNK